MSTKPTSDHVLESLKRFSEERISATASRYDVVNVVIDPDADILRQYSHELFLMWDQATNLRGWQMPFTEEDLREYVRALVHIRVDYVNGHRVVTRPTDGIAVPSYLSVVLSNVGLAHDVELGLELRPKLPDSMPVTKASDLVWLEKMSRSIKTLSPLGVEYAHGYTRSRDGSYDFMSMTLLGEEVLNSSKHPHPVYALLAATLGVRGIETVLSPRITYGRVSHLASLIRHLATTKV